MMLMLMAKRYLSVIAAFLPLLLLSEASGASCSLTSKTGNTYYCVKSFVDVGTYNFTIYAKDGAGNSATGDGSFEIADLTPPVVHISYPSTGKIIRGTIVIRWNASDNHDPQNQIKIIAIPCYGIQKHVL